MTEPKIHCAENICQVRRRLLTTENPDEITCIKCLDRRDKLRGGPGLIQYRQDVIGEGRIRFNFWLPKWMMVLIDGLVEKEGGDRNAWMLDLTVAVIQGELEERHGVLKAREMLAPYREGSE